jgi:hypothetical protein
MILVSALIAILASCSSGDGHVASTAAPTSQSTPNTVDRSTDTVISSATSGTPTSTTQGHATWTLAQARARYRAIAARLNLKRHSRAFNRLYDDPDTTLAEWKAGCARVSKDDYHWARSLQRGKWPRVVRRKVRAAVKTLVSDSESYRECAASTSMAELEDVLNGMGTVQSSAQTIAALKFALGLPAS